MIQFIAGIIVGIIIGIVFAVIMVGLGLADMMKNLGRH